MSLALLLKDNEQRHFDVTGMRPPAPYHMDGGLTDHDLAHLADWATDCKDGASNPTWKRAYSLIREGADMLLRRRAMSQVDCVETADAGNLISGQHDSAEEKTHANTRRRH